LTEQKADTAAPQLRVGRLHHADIQHINILSYSTHRLSTLTSCSWTGLWFTTVQTQESHWNLKEGCCIITCKPPDIWWLVSANMLNAGYYLCSSLGYSASNFLYVVQAILQIKSVMCD